MKMELNWTMIVRIRKRYFKPLVHIMRKIGLEKLTAKRYIKYMRVKETVNKLTRSISEQRRKLQKLIKSTVDRYKCLHRSECAIIFLHFSYTDYEMSRTYLLSNWLNMSKLKVVYQLSNVFDACEHKFICSIRLDMHLADFSNAS